MGDCAAKRGALLGLGGRGVAEEELVDVPMERFARGAGGGSVRIRGRGGWDGGGGEPVGQAQGAGGLVDRWLPLGWSAAGQRQE